MDKERAIQQLKRGAPAWNQWRKNHPDNLSLDSIHLIGVNLDGIDFSNLSIRNAKIENCSLRYADFISSNLSGSSLKQSDFTGTKLIAACLDNTDLTGCKFNHANLITATTQGATMENIDFRGQDLSGFNLKGISLSGSNLFGQNLSRQDLSYSNLTNANLQSANLTDTNLSHADLQGADLRKAYIKNTIFKHAKLNGIDLSQRDFQSSDFDQAEMTNCDLRESILNSAILTRANITGSKLWKIQSRNWDISNITCEFAYWDKSGKEKTTYRKHEFERIFAESITIELRYPYRLTAFELTTLPIFIEHLQAVHWGIILRLKSISEVAGGALLKFVVIESGPHNPVELKSNLQAEAERVQTAQLSLRTNTDLQLNLREKIGTIREEFWPRLLELAADHERQQVRNLTVVFMDLKGFTTWGNDELSDKLSLFRGLVKPILKRWKASYPNMEGDSLRITFHNASMGLGCACMIRDVLTAAGFEIRIGVELGEVAVVHNEVTEITDLEGVAVSMAARLEALAEPGEVLVSHKVRHYTDHKKLFLFQPKIVKLRKSIGDKKQGDALDCYTVQANAPLQEIK